MIFSEEQFKALEPFEQHFETAIKSRYAKYPGSNAVHNIHQIYTEATKKAIRLNVSCSTCIFRLLVDCGELYFKDKQERAAKPKRTKKK
jgi:hypothetical protein